MPRPSSAWSGPRPRVTASQPKPRSRLRTLVTLWGVLLALAGMWWLYREWSGDRTLPAELLGVWRTTAPDYADRVLEITPATIVVRRAGRGISMYRVRRVRRDERGGSMDFTIEYPGEDGGREVLTVHLVQSQRPAIRLGHQHFVWRRGSAR